MTQTGTTFVDQAAAANLEALKKKVALRRAEKIESIRAFAAQNPDHPYTLANEHVLQLSAESDSWNGAGVLSMTGALWWALNLSVDLAFPHTVIFNATGGPDWTIAAFTSVVAGYFLVDPSRLGGEYDFRMQAASIGLGEISIDLYEKNGREIASFFGAAAGLSASKLTGTGELTYR